ncbi:unnamed protein product [Caretta caretta]
MIQTGRGGVSRSRPRPRARGRCASGASRRQSGPAAPQGTAPRPEVGQPPARRVRRSRSLRDDHRRAARHLRQHAGRVALPARGALPLRGRQQPQEAGVRGRPQSQALSAACHGQEQS